VGAAYSIKLKKHVTLLENTLLMLQDIKIQLQYLNMPLYELLLEIKTKKYFSEIKFIDECNKLIVSGVDFPDAWKNSVCTNPQYYKREEIYKLLHLGENLGSCNIENQLIIMDLHISYFHDFLEKAKSKQHKYGNMILILSVLSGCMIFIMVI
jgi:stage III sporulation protein AB